MFNNLVTASWGPFATKTACILREREREFRRFAAREERKSDRRLSEERRETNQRIRNELMRNWHHFFAVYGAQYLGCSLQFYMLLSLSLSRPISLCIFPHLPRSCSVLVRHYRANSGCHYFLWPSNMMQLPHVAEAGRRRSHTLKLPSSLPPTTRWRQLNYNFRANHLLSRSWSETSKRQRVSLRGRGRQRRATPPSSTRQYLLQPETAKLSCRGGSCWKLKTRFSSFQLHFGYMCIAPAPPAYPPTPPAHPVHVAQRAESLSVVLQCNWFIIQGTPPRPATPLPLQPPRQSV